MAQWTAGKVVKIYTDIVGDDLEWVENKAQEVLDRKLTKLKDEYTGIVDGWIEPVIPYIQGIGRRCVIEIFQGT